MVEVGLGEGGEVLGGNGAVSRGSKGSGNRLLPSWQQIGIK